MEIFASFNNAFEMGDWKFIFHALFEIITLFFMIYGAIYFFRGTRASYISLGILGTLILSTMCAYWFDFTVIMWIMNQFWAVIVIAFVVIFQPELRRFFGHVGQGRFSSKSVPSQKEFLDEILLAIRHLSKKRVGALIVLEKKQEVRAVAATGGVTLECKICAPLLESIFHPKSPLHDGAVVISNSLITGAHVILPLSHNEESHVGSLGTRHRAALGISEETDAIAIVVSEETGRIAIAHASKLRLDVQPHDFLSLLETLLSKESDNIQDLPKVGLL